VMTGARPGIHDAASPTNAAHDDRTPVTRGKPSYVVSSDPGCDRRPGRFWALDDETEYDEEEITTPTTEDLITAASRTGFSIEELIQAEAELHEVGKVSHSSPDSADFRCPRAGKIIRAITRGKSLKHQVKPWKGPLPKPRVSPPRTLGDAVIKKLLY
jgi:hypothetical protein